MTQQAAGLAVRRTVTVEAPPERAFAAYGERAQDMRDTFDSPGGWSGLLQRFAGAAAEGEG